MHINIANKHILHKILERKKKAEYSPGNIDLKNMLKEILLWANKFVPSKSGSILLDDPILNQNNQKAGVLYFVACFGKGSSALIETSLPVNVGIVGRTYLTGKPYISKKARQDKHFYSGIDKKTKIRTKSIICAPIKIRRSTIGVIELINRLNGINYSANDLTLLKIFAEYTSNLIQNSLDARRFGELSIRDNLTGLFNDRYLYDRLSTEVLRAVRKDKDLSLIFLDLDRFKEVNDNHGHLAGSRVLKEVGGVVLESLSGINSISVRYGGDEFVIILPDTGIKSALEFAESLRKTIESFVFLKNKSRGIKPLNIRGLVTSSIGVASLKANVAQGGTVKELGEALIKKADSAMYISKQLGKNRITLA